MTTLTEFHVWLHEWLHDNRGAPGHRPTGADALTAIKAWHAGQPMAAGRVRTPAGMISRLRECQGHRLMFEAEGEIYWVLTEDANCDERQLAKLTDLRSRYLIEAVLDVPSGLEW